MNVLLDAIKSLIPVRIEVWVGGIAGGVGMLWSYLFGQNNALDVLIAAMILDYATGVMAAYINRDMMLNSRRGFRGIAKKIMILMLVSFAHLLDNAVGQTIIAITVTWFFIGNEGLSVLENAAKAGLPVPESLKNTLEQLSKEKQVKK